MGRRPTIAVDGGGGDLGHEPVVEAAVEAVTTVDVLLVGCRHELLDVAPSPLPAGLTIVHAEETVAMDDDPVVATRTKRGSSLHRAAALVAKGKADAMVTPGNSGAALLTASAWFRRVPGVSHPALAVVLPAPAGGRPTVLLDVGATIDCSAQRLVEFGLMGREYARVRLKVDEPRVATLSNGSEPTKGGPLLREVAAGLAARVNYFGHVEGHDLLNTAADVVVTDGFTGDVALKVFEGTAYVTADVLMDTAAGLLAGVDEMRAEWHETSRARLFAEGGAVVLGLRFPCVICHGEARPGEIATAIELAATCVQEDLIPRLNEAVEALITEHQVTPEQEV